MRNMTQILVDESRRLQQAGRLRESIVCLENACHTRDVGSHRYLMEEIIRGMRKELNRGARA